MLEILVSQLITEAANFNCHILDLDVGSKNLRSRLGFAACNGKTCGKILVGNV